MVGTPEVVKGELPQRRGRALLFLDFRPLGRRDLRHLEVVADTHRRWPHRHLLGELLRRRLYEEVPLAVYSDRGGAEKEAGGALIIPLPQSLWDFYRESASFAQALLNNFTTHRDELLSLYGVEESYAYAVLEAKVNEAEGLVEVGEMALDRVEEAHRRLKEKQRALLEEVERAVAPLPQLEEALSGGEDVLYAVLLSPLILVGVEHLPAFRRALALRLRKRLWAQLEGTFKGLAPE